jgi:CheY-like chemotaxis protein/predicted DNA-binding protein (UPF0251 family)
LLRATLGPDSQLDGKAVQQAIVQAIKSLAPAPDVPLTVRIRRTYDILSLRYIQNLTQEQAAARLGITPRHLRREQQDATDTLARWLWEQRPGAIDDGVLTGVTVAPALDEPAEWRSQIRQEIASLRENAPSAVASVEKSVRSVVELESALAARHGVQIEMDAVLPDLMVAVHPTALRQILITAIGQLLSHMKEGTIRIQSASAAGEVRITISGQSARPTEVEQSIALADLVAELGGSLRSESHPDRADLKMTGDQRPETGGRSTRTFSCAVASPSSLLPPAWIYDLEIAFPAAHKATVLVVDDNLDLVHFYQRYIEGTRYQIVHLALGQIVLSALADIASDVIVLDVMLPDIDGWELLTQLRQHPSFRHIPIIVCSVIRQEELALALGAALYLPKPVRRREFIRALNQASATGMTSPTNTGAAC